MEHAHVVPAALLFVLGGCSEAPTMVVEHTFEELLLREDRVVLEEDAARPVTVGPMAPIPMAHTEHGVRPCAILPPPAEVAWDLEPAPEGSELEVELAVGEDAYRNGVPDSSVRFEIELDGRSLLDEVISAGASVPRGSRAWRSARLPSSAGGRLVLRTSFVGDGTAPVSAGFGVLRRLSPQRVRRTRASAERPNVVLVLIDTLRADRIGAYGDGEAHTPALDGLGRRGTLFETVYASSPWTWPSTASLLTGKTAPEHGFEDDDSSFLADSLDTLAELFQAAGVTTGAFSANPIVSAPKNFDQGFETWSQSEWSATRELLGDIEAWLDTYGEHRFFLYLHWIDPHAPYVPDGEIAARFEAEPIEVVQRTLRRQVDRRLAQGRHPALERTVAGLQRLYRGEVATVDRDLARLLETLDARGLSESTIVAVTSDHGEEFLEHDLLFHGKQLHEESLRVPLILAGPGVPAGARRTTPVENRHLATTLCNLAGVTVPPAFGGIDLLHGVACSEAAGEPMGFATRTGYWVDRESRTATPVPYILGMQLGRHRFIWNRPEERGGDGDGDWDAGAFALHDLEADPLELHDLSAERPDLVERYREILSAWHAAGVAARPTRLPGGPAVARELAGFGYGGSQDD